ncbi:MAG: GNAT family N-acetyltransferase [Bacteroidales bacterium]|nr:GNAT family N-acetyltransferase [Bacteroidales bacterium]
MIHLTELSESDHPHFAQDLFEEAFPEDERPPFSSIKHRPANFHFMVATNDDEPIGILTYWEFDDMIYVEHFAIDSELRNQGLGKVVFLNFLSQLKEQVVLEVELPHDEESEHRLEFYTSMGLFQNPQEYVQPPYFDGGNRVPMLILSKYELDDDEFFAMRKLLYREVYGVEE